MNDKVILVVDDEIDLLEMIQSIFERAGFFNILTASSGTEALKIWKERQPDMIILDIMMPGIDGLSVLREVRETSNIPVLLLTARGEAEDRVAGLEVGADDYLVKPFHPKELLLRVQVILNRTYPQKERYDINDLIEVIRMLRLPDGCPWDKVQTHESIRMNFIEEVYEVIEAIDKNDTALMREELGDVLMQVVFHAQMEREQGNFDFDDVCDEVCRKLIIRHPHVFSNVQAGNTDEAVNSWEQVKQQTKGQTTYTETLESVAVSLPALMRAQKVGKRAAKSGFDFANTADTFAKLQSEVTELQEAIQAKDSDAAAEELGDLLFSCTNLARALDVDAEETLTAATEKFIRRFAKVEQAATAAGKKMKDCSPEELETFWQQAKGAKTDAIG